MNKYNQTILIGATSIVLGLSALAYNHVTKFDLVSLTQRESWLNTKQSLESKPYKHLSQMITDAERDGMCLVVTSGYRSAEEQAKIKAKYGKLAENVGHSEHQKGKAVDLTACPMKDGVRDDSVERLELAKTFAELPEYTWLAEHAKGYGFTQTYSDEPWHWNYKKLL